MAIVDTLADLETVMKFMVEHDISELKFDGIEMRSRPKPTANPIVERRTTDEEILQNPYAGLKI